MITQDIKIKSPTKNILQRLNDSFKKARIFMSYWLIQKMAISKRELDPAPTLMNKLGDLLIRPFLDKGLIMQILMGPFSFQIFRVSHELGLFSYLNSNPGATLEDITQHLKIESYPGEILLLGLTGLKLIKKVNRSYYNSAITRIVTQNSENKFTQFYPKYMEYAHHILSHGIYHLKESMTKNKPAGLHKIFGDEATDYYYELSKNPTANKHFSQHMSAFSQINAQRLATLSLFKKINTLLDVGGGIGDVAISIAKENPNISVTVYDHPVVADLANKKFQEENLSSKLSALGADIMKKSFPENFDGVLFSHFIDIFSPETIKDLFKRSFNSLKSRGYIIIYTPVVNNDETGPMVNCLLGIYFLCLANGKGRFYSSSQITNWLQEIGYINIKTKYLPSSEAIVSGMKP